MALRRKGSRCIVVDGTAYRWRLRGRPTYDQGMCWSPCAYAVEDAGRPGTVLVVTTGRPHTGNWVGVPADPVLPGEVAYAVRTALARLEAGAPRLSIPSGPVGRLRPVGLRGG